MRAALRQVILPVAVMLLCAILCLAGIGAAITGGMPPYKDHAGESGYTEKITGRCLLEQSAAKEDNLIIFGSSELRTTEISTHPANFFAGKRAGFQVNLIGRGSCQSLTHAIQIAASGDALTGKKVALITSPQSYVPDGIAPDLFMANFSPQQFLELLRDEGLSSELKQKISARVAELLDAYEAMPGSSGTETAIRWKAHGAASPGLAVTIRNGTLAPYYSLSRYLYDLKDKAMSKKLLDSLPDALPKAGGPDIDWEEEEQAAIEAAKGMTGNNGFGMLDSYYTTYIGSRLERHQNRDAALDYSISKEYGDLRLLFEVCREKGIEPLFIHVPLHGAWSDYTGLTVQRRQQYYENVKTVAREYGVQILDLTGYEYEPYFMCDVMHLGWKGWLAVDQALIRYYNGV